MTRQGITLDQLEGHDLGTGGRLHEDDLVRGELRFHRARGALRLEVADALARGEREDEAALALFEVDAVDDALALGRVLGEQAELQAAALPAGHQRIPIRPRPFAAEAPRAQTIQRSIALLANQIAMRMSVYAALGYWPI